MQVEIRPLKSIALQAALWSLLGSVFAFSSEGIFLQREPVRAYIDRGFQLGKEGKWPEALLQLRRAVEIDPTSAEAHYSLGVSLFWTKQVQSAIEELKLALRLDPHLAPAHHFLAQGLREIGEWHGAAHHFEEAI